MSMPPKPLVQPGPDRILARASALAVTAWLVLLIAAALAIDTSMQRQRAAAAGALRAEAAAGHGRALAASLDLMAVLPSRDVPKDTRARATADGETLRRLAAAPFVPRGLPVSAIEAVEAALLLIRNDGKLGAPAVLALVEEALLPVLEKEAAVSRAEALTAAAAVRGTLLAAITLQLAGTLALAFAVLLPARAQIRAWMEERAEIDREIRFRQLHDPLTEMPNATYFHAYLARVAAGAQRSKMQTAVLRIDLDHFRFLRATLGNRACDEILRLASRRILASLRTGDFAAYLGQDNFVVVAGDLLHANDASTIAGRVQDALTKPFVLQEGARQITCSIGITLLSDDVPDPEQLLVNATIALAQAQDVGAGNVRYFSNSLREEVDRRAALYSELLAGLERGEFLAFFQPQMSIETGAFTGFEALTRWEHPARGLLAPPDFLDFAEETGLTARLGELMLTRTLEALVAWDAAGLVVPRVGVNFALAQLRDPRLVEKIKWETERFNIDPSRLAIEVLETVLIKSDTDIVVRNLRGLVSAGFRIELDDFGTGHASISNLRRFMVERIKIDRSFIAGIESSKEQQQLTASMIGMANALGISTLAEGVESEAAVAMLRRLGCDEFQGFFAARAMPFSESLAWLPRHGAAGGPTPGPGAGTGTPNTA